MDTILIIEDSKDVNLMLAETLIDAGYEVKSLFTGILEAGKIYGLIGQNGKNNAYILILILGIVINIKSVTLMEGKTQYALVLS